MGRTTVEQADVKTPGCESPGKVVIDLWVPHELRENKVRQDLTGTKSQPGLRIPGGGAEERVCCCWKAGWRSGGKKEALVLVLETG
jgi:hypothetical protein